MPLLTWLGKNVSELACRQTPICALEPHQQRKIGVVLEDNMLIRGDNLVALRALLPYYRGKIKLVYADPPYNTGNSTWIYNDAMNAEETVKWLDQVVGPEDLARSDKWLCMMQPRLEAIYDLLADDGVFVCSIDDAELNNLINLLDAQFGKENKIGLIVRATNSTKSNSHFLSVNYDYTVIYAKNKSLIEEDHQKNNQKWEVPKNNVAEYQKRIEYLRKKKLSNDEITKELKELTKYPRFIDFTNYWYVDKRGVYMKDNLGGVNNGNTKPVKNPLTNKNDPVPPGGFRYKEEEMVRLVKEDRIHFHSDGSLPRIKRYLEENLTQRPKGIMSDDQRPDANLMKDIGIYFDNPKQLTFVERIIQMATSQGDLILDPFAGSGTTAHAVLKLNAENPTEKPRRFIAVEMEKEVEEKVTFVRLDRVIKGYKTPKGKEVEGLGGAYSRWQVGEAIRNPDGSLNENCSYRSLAQVLAAYHQLPLLEKMDGPLIAEDQSQLLFFYHGPAGNTFGSKELAEVEKLAAGRSVIVYTENSFVDNERAADHGIEIQVIPYDFPVQPIE